MPVRRPLIFLPGILGSELHFNRSQAWPSAFKDWIKMTIVKAVRLEGGRYKLDESSSYPGEAVDVIRYTVKPVSKMYQATIDALLQLSNNDYVEGQNFFVHPYDFRRDVRDGVFNYRTNSFVEKTESTSLVDLIHKACAKAREQNLEERVDLLCHSMGGLVAVNCLLQRTGGSQSLIESVVNIVTLGTPFFGAPKAYKALFSGDAPDDILNYIPTTPDKVEWRTMSQNHPSIYQLCPNKQLIEHLQTETQKVRTGTSLFSIKTGTDIYPLDTFEKVYGMKGWLSKSLFNNCRNNPFEFRDAAVHEGVTSYVEYGDEWINRELLEMGYVYHTEFMSALEDSPILDKLTAFIGTDLSTPMSFSVDYSDGLYENRGGGLSIPKVPKIIDEIETYAGDGTVPSYGPKEVLGCRVREFSGIDHVGLAKDYSVLEAAWDIFKQSST